MAKLLSMNWFSARRRLLDCKDWRSEAPEACDFALGFPLPASFDSIAPSEDTMRPKKHEATWEGDLFRARLDQIIMCGCPRRIRLYRFLDLPHRRQFSISTRAS